MSRIYLSHWTGKELRGGLFRTQMLRFGTASSLIILTLSLSSFLHIGFVVFAVHGVFHLRFATAPGSWFPTSFVLVITSASPPRGSNQQIFSSGALLGLMINPSHVPVYGEHCLRFLAPMVLSTWVCLRVIPFRIRCLNYEMNETKNRIRTAKRSKSQLELIILHVTCSHFWWFLLSSGPTCHQIMRD